MELVHCMKKREPLVSVVLSFYNEEDVLEELIARLHKALKPLPIRYEFIFVNDASTDESLEILKRHAECDCAVKVVNMSRNFGRARQGVCIVAGIEHAAGDAIIFMDTDLQDPPEVLPEMIEKWLESDDVEVVYTTRLSRAGESESKLWLTKWGYQALRFASDVDLPVDSGDFKLISRKIADYLLSMHERRPFLRGMIPWLGFRQVPVFYDREARVGGRTKYPVLSGRVIHNFLHGLISFSDAPLRLPLWLGMGLLTMALAGLLAVLVTCLCGVEVQGWVTTVLAVAAFSGLQFVFLGIFGMYLGIVHDEVRNRPRYVDESRVGFDAE